MGTELKVAWEQFITDGTLLSDVSPRIAADWKRCRQLGGVDPTQGCCREILSPEEHNASIADDAELLEVARPFISSLYNILNGSDLP